MPELTAAPLPRWGLRISRVETFACSDNSSSMTWHVRSVLPSSTNINSLSGAQEDTKVTKRGTLPDARSFSLNTGTTRLIGAVLPKAFLTASSMTSLHPSQSRGWHSEPLDGISIFDESPRHQEGMIRTRTKGQLIAKRYKHDRRYPAVSA